MGQRPSRLSRSCSSGIIMSVGDGSDSTYPVEAYVGQRLTGRSPPLGDSAVRRSQVPGLRPELRDVCSQDQSPAAASLVWDVWGNPGRAVAMIDHPAGEEYRFTFREWGRRSRVTRVSGGAAASATNGGSSSVERCSVGGPVAAPHLEGAGVVKNQPFKALPRPRDAHSGRVFRWHRYRTASGRRWGSSGPGRRVGRGPTRRVLPAPRHSPRSSSNGAAPATSAPL